MIIEPELLVVAPVQALFVGRLSVRADISRWFVLQSLRVVARV